MRALKPFLRNEHERSIRYFKEEIGEHGYGAVKELFQTFKDNPYLSEEYRYKLAILLSIARWEYELTTGSQAKRSEGHTPEGCCGLCLYHNVYGNGKCVSEAKGTCILYEPYNELACCREYREREKDGGEALIKKMREAFKRKYYRKFKYYKNGEEIMKEDKTQDKISKIRDRAMTPLLKRIRLEMLVTEREGMVAANRHLQSHHQVDAYQELDFIKLKYKMKELLGEIDNPTEKP